MIEAGMQSSELQSLRVENEQLKAMTEIMKAEMEQVLKEIEKRGVKLNRDLDEPKSELDSLTNLTLQKQIIQKEKVIFELERKLTASRDQILKLKEERERLVQISSQIKAELNKKQALIQEYQSQLGIDGTVGMFSNNNPNQIRYLQQSHSMIREDSREDIQDSNTPNLSQGQIDHV